LTADVVKEFVTMHEQFFAKKGMTIEEAEVMGLSLLR
jgi:hypothetical protein